MADKASSPDPPVPSLGDGTNCPVPLPHHDRIVLGHGSGGRLTGELIEQLFLPILNNDYLKLGEDAAVLPIAELVGTGSGEDCGEGGRAGPGAGGDLALTTDSYVVRPLFFPGGDIGHLAVCGTVNDLAMMGARPLWLTAGFLIEEGFPTADLARIVRSMRAAADTARVLVVAGDTKVVERGKVDGLFITTAGVGRIPAGRAARVRRIQPGDEVLVSGTLGDHGIAVLAARGDLALQTEIASDAAVLNGLVEAMYATGADIHALRDPTRGGLAASLNELADGSGTAIVLQEDAIPVREDVAGACELLGFDPLQVANEGKLVAIVQAADSDAVLAAMRADPCGAAACRIGRVEAAPAGRVLLETGIGGRRIVDVPAGELLPRIC